MYSNISRLGQIINNFQEDARKGVAGIVQPELNETTLQGVNSAVSDAMSMEGGGRPQEHDPRNLASQMKKGLTELSATQKAFRDQGKRDMVQEQMRVQQEMQARSVASEVDVNPMLPRGDPFVTGFTNKARPNPSHQPVGNLAKQERLDRAKVRQNDAEKDKTASYAAWGIMLGLALIAVGLIVTDTVTIGAKTPFGSPIENIPQGPPPSLGAAYPTQTF
jgi:hypothetical protein